MDPPPSASTLPSIILRDIFQHTLPHLGRGNPQPDKTVAPMLLCQVCQSWRRVALEAVPLWSHLDYFFRIWWDGDEDFLTYAPRIMKRDIEFLKWWKERQGSLPPSLSFSCLPAAYVPGDPREHLDWEVEAGDLKFLVRYMSSARLLRIDETLFKYLIGQHYKSGNGLPKFPDLETLITEYKPMYRDRPEEELVEEAEEGTFYSDYISPLVSLPRPALRRLSLRNAYLYHMDEDLFANWSILTHLSMECLDIYLQSWFLLLRSVPGLRWGYFDLSNLRDDEDPDPEYVNSTEITFPDLSMLILNVECFEDETPLWNSPIARPLKNVYMPFLQDLSLYLSNKTWTHQLIAEELYPVLAFAPQVVKLSFGPYDPFSDEEFHIEPLSKYAPNLTDFRVQWELNEFNFDDLAAESKRFIEQVFFPGGWGDLSSPANAIQKITIDLILDRSRDIETMKHINPRDAALLFVTGSVLSIVKDSVASTAQQYMASDSGEDVVFEVVLDAQEEWILEAKRTWSYDGV